MREITLEELKIILGNHLHWLREDVDGWQSMKADLSCADLSCADLSCADLSCADLRYANLRYANLSDANLSDANLSCADLRDADLSDANLSCADLRGANLSCANLRYADLRGANLSCANLRGADLCGAKIDDAVLNKFYPIACPEYGSFIGWKKAGNKIIKLEITEDAKRSSAFTRKCRCSKAKVLAIENADGTNSEITTVRSDYDRSFVYTVGDIVTVDKFDPDRKNECAPGIHFFITRQEAVDY